jgi:hypothetical protein
MKRTRSGYGVGIGALLAALAAAGPARADLSAPAGGTTSALDTSQPVIGQVSTSTDYSTYLYRSGQTASGTSSASPSSGGQILGTNLSLGLGPVKPSPLYMRPQLVAISSPAGNTPTSYNTAPATVTYTTQPSQTVDTAQQTGLSPLIVGFSAGGGQAVTQSGGSSPTTPTGTLVASAGPPPQPLDPVPNNLTRPLLAPIPLPHAGPNFGAGIVPQGAPAAVPEPSALVLAGLGAAGVFLGRRRGCRAAAAR